MRTVRITSKRCIETADRTILTCPLRSISGTTNIACNSKCAWFRIDEIDNKNYVYCSEKLIGEIKETENEQA